MAISVLCEWRYFQVGFNDKRQCIPWIINREHPLSAVWQLYKGWAIIAVSAEDNGVPLHVVKLKVDPAQMAVVWGYHSKAVDAVNMFTHMNDLLLGKAC